MKGMGNNMLDLAQVLIYGVLMASITLLFSEYDGPFNILKEFRKKTRFPSCGPCASIWVAVFFFVFTLFNVNIPPAWGLAFLIIRNF